MWCNKWALISEQSAAVEDKHKEESCGVPDFKKNAKKL